jgi:hypothetical protein
MSLKLRIFFSVLICLVLLGILGGVVYAQQYFSGIPFVSALQLLPCSLDDNAYQRARCARPVFERMTIDESAQFALDHVYKLQESTFIADCHVPAHWIGETNLSKYDDDVGMAFATCASGCMEGCHHGVIESYISTQGERSINTNFCKELGQGEQLLYRQCLHGLGHALMRHNVVPFDMALKQCGQLDSSFAVTTCEGGVQMEFSDFFVEQGIDSLVENVPTMCDDVSTSAKVRCIESVGYSAMVVTGFDLDEASQICNLLPDESDRLHCEHATEEEAKNNTRDFRGHLTNERVNK